MSDVYRIEVAAPQGEFSEIGMFSQRGAIDFIMNYFAALDDATGAYLAANLAAETRLRKRAEIANWLKSRNFRTEFPLTLFAYVHGIPQVVAEFRVTCYIVHTNWL